MADTLPIFIHAKQLHERLRDADIQVVAVDTASDFAGAHIPGALQVSMADITSSAAPVAGLIPDDARLAEVLSHAGLRNDAHIVAYDRAGDGQAARLLYTLDAVGHSAISLLDGGLAAWHEAGFELADGAAQTGASDFSVDRQAERIADRQWIESHLDDSAIAFLDARSAPEYAGADVRSARGGHIPGAISLDWNLLKGSDGKLRPDAELRGLLHSHGVDRDKDIVNYCQSHVRSSYTYLVLKYLGFEKVRGYPGAWSDWGNAQDTPINTSDDANRGL